MLEITDIRVRLVANDSNLKAFASFTIDGAFVVHDVRIIDGPNGYFVSMPSRRTPNGEFRDIVHPIDSEARTEFENEILTAYSNYIELEKALNSEN